MSVLNEVYYKKPLVEKYGEKYFEYFLRNRYEDDFPPPVYIHQIRSEVQAKNANNDKFISKVKSKASYILEIHPNIKNFEKLVVKGRHFPDTSYPETGLSMWSILFFYKLVIKPIHRFLYQIIFDGGWHSKVYMNIFYYFIFVILLNSTMQKENENILAPNYVEQTLNPGRQDRMEPEEKNLGFYLNELLSLQYQVNGTLLINAILTDQFIKQSD